MCCFERGPRSPRPCLVFDWRSPAREWCRDVEDDLGVVRRGPLDVDAVRDLLDRSNIVVMPSRSEGMGRLALEAHGRGRPVVASAVGGLPEVVEDGETGVLVPPDDPRLAGRGDRRPAREP